jgi:photosystem II stability/assembly factor-like uncharacterized protein
MIATWGESVRPFFVFILLLMCAVAAHPQSWKVAVAPTEADLVAIYFTSSDRGFVAGDNGYLASTSDGGGSWNRYQLNTTEDINEIYFRNEKNGYLVAGRKLFITSDGGETWRETVLYGPNEIRNGTPELLSIRFADKRRGLAVGSVWRRVRNEEVVVDSLVMRTQDGGESWQRIAVPSKTELFHLYFNGSSRAWIAGDDGVILASTDGGVTWQRQTSGTRESIYNIHFRDEKEGYAVGAKGLILRTEDGGRVWQRVASGTASALMRIDFTDDRNGWIAGHKGMLLRSTDKGRSWSSFNSPTRSNLYGLHIEKKFGWAVGQSGTLMYYQR